MRRRLGFKGGFALTEIIIAVAFLAVAGLILMQMFISSRYASIKAADVDEANSRAQAVAEIIKSGVEPQDIVFEDLGRAEADGDVYTFSYDKVWFPCKRSEAAYVMTIEVETEQREGGSMSRFDIRTCTLKPYPLDEKPFDLVAFSVARYTPATVEVS